MIIEIVTIGKVPAKLLHDFVPALEKAFSPFIDGCLIGASPEMQPAAYNPSRGQYDARLILGQLLRHITGENRVLAWTDVDLYVPDKNFVFGLAQYLGRAALVSLKRLNPTFYSMSPNYRLMLERATKESVHELGHVFGLEHCSNKTCVMSFSNSIFEVDKKAATFCKRCQSFYTLGRHDGGAFHAKGKSSEKSSSYRAESDARTLPRRALVSSNYDSHRRARVSGQGIGWVKRR